MTLELSSRQRMDEEFYNKDKAYQRKIEWYCAWIERKIVFEVEPLSVVLRRGFEGHSLGYWDLLRALCCLRFNKARFSYANGPCGSRDWFLGLLHARNIILSFDSPPPLSPWKGFHVKEFFPYVESIGQILNSKQVSQINYIMIIEWEQQQKHKSGVVY